LNITEMSALFDFNSFLTVVLLFICSCTYYKLINPSGLTQRTGWVPRAGGEDAPVGCAAAVNNADRSTPRSTLRLLTFAHENMAPLPAPTTTTASEACSGRRQE